MRTTRDIATISYNSPTFLNSRLEELLRSRKIQFYVWIHHLPEEDEKKPHKHLFIRPNGQMDTDALRELFLEVDLSHPTEKPLGTLNFKPSKFMDWYLYSLHDSAYLESKGQSRKYHYTREDFVTSDQDELTEEIHQMDLSKVNRQYIIKSAAESGVPFAEVISRGQIPIQQTIAYQRAYEIIQAYTYRNNRPNHEEDSPE